MRESPAQPSTTQQHRVAHVCLRPYKHSLFNAVAALASKQSSQNQRLSDSLFALCVFPLTKHSKETNLSNHVLAPKPP